MQYDKIWYSKITWQRNHKWGEWVGDTFPWYISPFI